MVEPSNEGGRLLTTELRELLELLRQSEVVELSIERDGTKIQIKRAVAASPSLLPAVAAMSSPSTQATAVAAAVPAVPEPLSGAPGSQTINAPMVGTFYGSPAPNEPPFVQEGEEVHLGMVVGIVEAMKMMNEIESEVAGRIVRVLAQNGQPIEFGQPLFVVEPL